jgi:HEAT repeat protein
MARRPRLRPPALLVIAPLLAPVLAACGGAPVAKPTTPTVVAPAKAGPFAQLPLPADARVIWATYRETWRTKAVEDPRNPAAGKRARLVLEQRALIGLELLRPDASGFVAPPASAPAPAAEPGVKALIRVHAIAFGPRMAPVTWDSHEFEDTPTPRESLPVVGPIAPAIDGCETFGAIDAFLRDFPNLTLKTGMAKPEFRARALPIAAALLASLVAGMPDPTEPSLAPSSEDDDKRPPPKTCEAHGNAKEAFADALERLRAWASSANGDADAEATGGPTKPKPASADFPFGDPAQRWLAVVRAFELQSAAAPFIEEALEKGDTATRRAALVAAWGAQGDVALVVPTLKRARDADPQVRAYAWFALGALGTAPRAAIPVFVELFREGDAETRERALERADLMAAVDVRAFAPKLGELANGPDDKLAEAALDGLRRLGGNAIDALPALRTALEAKSPARRLAALGAISWLRSAAADAAPSVVARTKDADAGVRAYACGVLHEIDAPAKVAVPPLIDTLADAEAAVREAALRGLRPYAADANAAIPKAIALLGDASFGVRIEAARFLGASGAKASAAVPKLLDVLADASSGFGLKDASIEAIGAIGPAAKASLPTLMKFVKGSDESLRRTAIRAVIDLGPAAAGELPALVQTGLRISSSYASSLLERAGGKLGRAAVPTLLEYLAGEDRELRRGAVRGLGALGKDAGPEVPKLLERLDDEYVRRDVFAALRSIGPAAAAAIPKMIELIDKPSWRYDAFSVLSKIGAPALPKLLAVMKDKARPTEIRTGAVNALLEAGPVAAPHTLAVLEVADELGLSSWVFSNFDKVGKPAIAPLTTAAHGKHAGVRARAIMALGEFRGDATHDAVVALLGLMKDPETAAAARRSLEGMGRSRALPALQAVLADPKQRDLHEYARSYVEKWK